ncbi:MAG: hypothetical protein HY047_20570 [Acidobacteria bacterium]|nr:hypothetical protein [Acidobacteriota bacterium]
MDRPAPVRLVMLLLGVCSGVFAGCGGAGTTSPDPDGPPTAIILTGAWSGSLSRPKGLNPIDVSWVDKPSGSFAGKNVTFSGPVMLSQDTNALSGTLSAALSGTAASPALSLSLNVDPGAALSTLKSCSVLASAAQATIITNTSIVATVTISFTACQALVNGQSTATETDLLTLSKLYVSRETRRDSRLRLVRDTHRRAHRRD